MGNPAELLMLPTRIIGVASRGPRRARQIYDSASDLAATARAWLLRINEILSRIEVLLDRIDLLVREVAVVAQAAAETTAAAGGVTTRAGSTNTRAAKSIGRIEHLLDTFGPSLIALAPAASDAATTLTPERLRAIGRLLDLAPDVIDLVDPALRSMIALAPDLDELAERLNNVGDIVEGIPGADLLKRRARSTDESDPGT